MLAGGREDAELCAGGVSLVGSFMLIGCVRIGSGDRLGGVGWGIVVSKSSERRRFENVRLASSAMSSFSERSPDTAG